MACGCENFTTLAVRTQMILLFPEFSTFDTTRLDAFIDISKTQINCNAFGSMALTALVYFSAYNVAVADEGVTSGLVKKDKTDELEREWSVGTTVTGSHSTNKYGVLYDNLRRGILSVSVTGGC